MTVYKEILSKATQKKKQIAHLIHPDKTSVSNIIKLSEIKEYKEKIDIIFIGSSLLIDNDIDEYINTIKQITKKKVVLFPGSCMQVSKSVDAILFLSLISGRNPELLIGQHVITAPTIKKHAIETISTGYMLIDGGNQTSVQYISNTFPIPRDKNDIAISTAIAGEMLGMKLIYIDAGSGASFPISKEMIKSIKSNISIPLIVGGGIRSKEEISSAFESGADIVVIGNVLESSDKILFEI